MQLNFACGELKIVLTFETSGEVSKAILQPFYDVRITVNRSVLLLSSLLNE